MFTHPISFLLGNVVILDFSSSPIARWGHATEFYIDRTYMLPSGLAQKTSLIIFMPSLFPPLQARHGRYSGGL